MTDAPVVRSCEFIRTLICGLAESARKRRLFGMLTGFFDDSGSEGLGPVFVLAGYIADAETWMRFSDAWQAELNRPPSLEYFKMREANSLRKQFYGWTTVDRDRRVQNFVRIVREHVSFGATCSMWWEDFKSIRREFPDIPLEPYDVLFHGVMSSVFTHQLYHWKADKVDFIFDDQGQMGIRAASTFDAIRSLLLPEEQALVGGRPTQRNDRDFLPLQAADLIAWQTRRFIAEHEGKTELADLVANTPALQELEKVLTLYSTYGLDRLRTIAERCRFTNATGWQVSSIPCWWKTRE